MAYGAVARTANYLPTSFDLSLLGTVEGFRQSGLLKPEVSGNAPLSKALKDILARPWTHPPSNSSPTAAAGGGRRRNKKKGAPTSFDEVWLNLPVHKIIVFAIPSPSPQQDTPVYDITIIVIDRLKHVPATALKGFFLRLPRSVVLDEAAFETEIAKCFRGMEWGDFEDYDDSEASFPSRCS